MKKLFTSKVAFIAFVIIFTSFLLIVFKDTTARVGWSLSMGALSGFVFAQWYWIEKMKKIQNLIDARMASPETTELLKRKEDELFEASNRNLKLVDRISELQSDLSTFQKSYEDVKNERDVLSNLVGAAQRMREASPYTSVGYQPTDTLDTTNPPKGE